jgi:signal transduction histidine kinase
MAWLLFWGSGLAWAHDFVTESAWVEDVQGKMTIDQVRQQPATPFDHQYFSRGFSQSTFWLRFRIDPHLPVGHASTEELVIRIRPPYQDQIQLFDPLADHDRVRKTGDYFDWADDEYRSLNLNFIVPLGDKPRDVWLRLRSNQSTMTIVEVMTLEEVRAADRRQEMIATLYFAALLVCMGWAILSYINQPDRLVGRYILREVLAIVYALIMLGYFRVLSSGWLPVELLDPVSNIMIWLFLAYVIWFDTKLIQEFKPHPWLTRVLLTMPWVFPVNMALMALGKPYWANILSAYLTIAAIFLIFFAAVSTRAWVDTANAEMDDKPVFSKAFLVGVYGSALLVILINRLPIMGLTTALDGFLYLNLLYAILSSIMMMVLIQVRASRLAQRHQDAQRRFEVAQLEAAQERAQRLEQSNFLKMLAHEMKTPLSVVRMAIGRDKSDAHITNMADRAVKDMNSIIDHLLEVEKLNDQQLKIRTEDFDLVEMVQHVSKGLPEGPRIHLNAPEVATIESDARFVQMILSNLIENAIKYGAEQAPIRVTIEKKADGYSVEVCNPVGTAGAPDPAHVFDKYYRAPGAYERTGSGLGLYLANALSVLLEGALRYQEQNGMICFQFYVPCRRG